MNDSASLTRLRVGTGYDVHATGPGSCVILGGCQIPAPFALVGHSDADVLLHAVCDALLGASARGDIGGWFPDTDEAHRDADSSVLLGTVWESLRDEGWQLVNLDTVIIAEQPTLAAYIGAMRERMSEVLAVEQESISVKATTHEKLGPLGRGEGIAAIATVLLIRPAVAV